VKEYKATLNFVKGKWYVCMTVPEEVRYLLNSQIKLSTGTSDKNEAQKRLPELAIKLKQKIADAKAISDADEFRKEVKAIATKLNRSAEFDIDKANASQLIAILQQLSTSETQDVIHQGKYHLSNLKQHLSAHRPSVGRLDRQTRNDEVKRVKSLLRQHNPSLKSFKSLALAWAEKKKWGREKSKQAFLSQVNRFIEIVGDIDLESIRPVTLYDFADAMVAKYDSSNATVRNYITSISDALNYAVRNDLITTNPAKGLDLRSYGKAAVERRTFSVEALHSLFSQSLPEDIRMLWSIMITTGMRLDEVALLAKSDIKFEGRIQYFDLTDAILKTDGSARKVPVPKIIVRQLSSYLEARNTERLFDFPLNADGKAQNAASHKGMRYIREITSDPRLVMHSMRHTFKDLSRNAGIPKDLHDFITGHRGGDTASNYGEGHSLAVKYEALNKISHPYLMG